MLPLGEILELLLDIRDLLATPTTSDNTQNNDKNKTLNPHKQKEMVLQEQ